MNQQSLRRTVLKLAICLAVTSLHLNSGSAGDADPNSGILTLAAGDSFSGQLRASDQVDAIRWMNRDFLDPFAFHVEAVESIRYPNRTKFQSDEKFVVECVDGDVLCGEIIDWSADQVELRSKTMSRFSVAADRIRHIHRAAAENELGVRFLTGLSDWQTPGWTTEGWIDHGDHLGTSIPGASLNGDFRMPARAFIDIELSWDSSPDFVVAFATDPNSTEDRAIDGWRMETAESQLILIRESESTADVDVVRELAKLERIRLFIFLDQRSGEMQVHLPTGEPIAKVTGGRLDDDRKSQSLGSGLRLINRSGSLRIDRLRIVSWTGEPPWQPQTAPIGIHRIDQEPAFGKFARFDPESGLLVIEQEQESMESKLSEITSVRFRTEPEPSLPSQTVFRLRDGSQVSGKLSEITKTHWVLTDKKFIDPVRLPRDQVHYASFSQPESELPSVSMAKIGLLVDGNRIGSIELEASRHLGWIAESAAADDDDDNKDNADGDNNEDHPGTSAIRWQPLSSKVSSRLKPDVSGRILYEDLRRPGRLGQTGNRTGAARSLRRVGDKQFGTLFLESVDRVESRRARRDQHVVHLASGDVIACRVESIGPSGVTLSTAGQENVLVANEEIKAIELVRNADLPDLSDAKQDRLLTLPRLQRSSPPTHILCSTDGDLLRCRLVRARQNSIDVEVQMELISIARERVSHIIWLHPETESSQPQVNDRYRGLVQVRSLDQKRMTFQPTETTQNRLIGTSKILGTCDVELAKVREIVLGNQIANESRKLKYAEWELAPAIEPLIMQTVVADEPASATSRLIGQPAPNIVLERLDGGSFDLSDYRGQIVVLDFWASWCAPCLTSMPALQQSLDQFDATKVAMIGINLEERRDVAASALERMGIELVVGLDIDGDTAAIYRASAIPQTVIVDANGRVADVVVGGAHSTADTVRKIVQRLLN